MTTPKTFPVAESVVDLGPCRFCHTPSPWSGLYSGSPTISCIKCPASMGGEESTASMEELASAWNAQPADAGEIVAYQRQHPVQGWIGCKLEDTAHYADQGQAIRPLFAHPTPTDTGLVGELVEALVGIFEHFKDRAQAPGHCHDEPGIWDSDNGPGKAGTPCDWCAHWERARTALSKAKDTPHG